MEKKYQIIVDTHECYDAEGYYAWKIEDGDGYEVTKGLAKTPLLGFAEAMSEVERFKNQQ